MSFSVIKTLQRTISTITNRLIAPKTLQITENRGIHQICIHHSSTLNTTSSQSILKPLTNFLAPTSLLFNQVCGMKQRGRLQLRCRGCYYVARQGRLYVMCRLKPRHKQMQMVKKYLNKAILTFAYQKKVRDW